MGENIDLTKLTKTGNLEELKNMLAVETKKMHDMLTEGKSEMHVNYIATGGGKKKTGNNSNKIWDYKHLNLKDGDDDGKE